MTNLITEKLKTVDEALTIYKYSNGYMIDIPGRDFDDNWANIKIVASTIDELLELIKKAYDLPTSI